MRVSPVHIGFHMANRGGNPPSEQRCVELLRDIIGNGFDPDEADCGGVLVPSPSQDSEAIDTFNARACAGQARLAPTVNGQRLVYGSLTHSHLNQIFKNLLAGLCLGVAEVSDAGGRASLSVLESSDPRFAKYCRDGLLWDVMRPDINNDPEALGAIQAAGNAKNAVGMVAHEAEAIAEIGSRCGTPTQPKPNLPYEPVVKQLGTNYKAMVSDPHFRDLFSFVVNLGGNSAPFIPHLQDFLSRMVNPKVRASVVVLWGPRRFRARRLIRWGKDVFVLFVALSMLLRLALSFVLLLTFFYEELWRWPLHWR